MKPAYWRILFGLALATGSWAQGEPLRVGLAGERQLTGATPAEFSGTLAAGEVAHVVITQAGTDVVVTLRDPTGRTVFRADIGNGAHGPETVAYTARSAGEYRLEVKAPAGGAFRFQVLAWGPGDRELAEAFSHFEKAEAALTVRSAAGRSLALAEYALALPYFIAKGDRYYEAIVQFSIGSVQAAAAQFRPALKSIQDAGRLFTLLGDQRRLAATKNFEGGMWDVLGEPLPARTAYQDALARHRANADRAGEGLVLNNLGILEANLGNWQASLSSYALALPIVQATGDRRRAALLVHNIGLAHLGLGDASQARPMFEKALAARQAVGDKRGEADTEGALGYTEISLNRPAEAIPHLERARILGTESADKLAQVRTARNYGEALRRLGRLAEAETSLRQGLALASEIQERRQGAAIGEALAIVKLEQGNAPEALTLAEAALETFRAITDRAGEARTLATIARIQAASGQLTTAKATIDRSLAIAESIRREAHAQELRALYLASRQNDYEFAVDLLMRLKDPAAAFAMAERARARGLLDMLSEAGAGLRMDAPAPLLAQARQIGEKINALGARLLPVYGRKEADPLLAAIQNLETQRQEIETAIRQASPRYASVTQPVPLGVEQLQKEQLEPGTVLLEFVLGQERSYLFAASKTAFQSYVLPGRQELESLANTLAQALKAQNDEATKAAAAALSHSILAPAAAMLTAERLIVIADGALQRVPFAVLPRPGSPALLVETMETVSLPSASSIALLRAGALGRPRPTRSIAMFADPVFRGAPAPTRLLEHFGEGNTEIPQLPYTRREAEQITRLTPKAGNLLALGAKANRPAALDPSLAEYRFVHFATHGYLDPERPGLSALLLSFEDEKGGREDGFLRVNDIYNLEFHADLVVLSACQTGLGKDVRGEGLLGMPRAFLYAGAPRVVVSLWNVNDRATAELMTTMYRRMLQNGLRPAAALRQAQLALRKQSKWASPYYWAAFVQQGEWR
ncbi:MAG: CHAT domain-containing protein [Acidobacteria bacterium]|nr:CHAT domain-containing protein [Acidobacteriota bacterium]